MPLVLDDRPAVSIASSGGSLAARIEIGLVNNMPDGALQQTEQQFITLLAAASGPHTVRLHRFAMPGVARGPGAAAHIADCYSDYAGMDRMRLDGLIVTGCEPRAASLTDEPFWDSFTRLVDWAESNTVSTLWSCLAAHAAVLHCDGIARRRLPSKRSGVYRSESIARHPLLERLCEPMQVAHSRWNDLAASDLDAHGYSVLTRSAAAGVDLFVKPWKSLFVFFQGHPEYDPDSLAREFRRDIARYLRGEQGSYPSQPENYFDEATEAALQAFGALALVDRTSVGLRDLPRTLGLRVGLAEHWRRTSLPVFGAWIDLMAQGGVASFPSATARATSLP